jgi:hypothetical protein
MRYLKKFLITERVDLDELQKLCDNTLAYLIDEGFKIEINQFNGKGYNGNAYISILLKKPNDIFYWSEYKDDIIPFIEYLYEKYNCEERISLIDKHNASTQLKIANPKLGYHNKTEIKTNYLENLEIEYLLSGIFFYINIE